MQGAADSAQRLEAAEVMLARYGQENERLAAINEALVSRRAFVDSDYTSKPFLRLVLWTQTAPCIHDAGHFRDEQQAD